MGVLLVSTWAPDRTQVDGVQDRLAETPGHCPSTWAAEMDQWHLSQGW